MSFTVADFSVCVSRAMTLDLAILIASCDGYAQYVDVCIRSLYEVLPEELLSSIYFTSQTYEAKSELVSVRNLPTGPQQ